MVGGSRAGVRRRRALALVLATLELGACADVTTLWDKVPSYSSLSSFDLPPGCKCAEDPSLSSCTKFECDCVCDITAGACDENCCCDQECTAAEIARFESQSACLEEGTEGTLIQQCLDGSAVASINAKQRMVLEESQTGLGSLLCVTVDRNPGKGEFFSDPGAQTMAVFSSAAVSGNTAYSSSSFAPDALASTATAYTVGDPLRTDGRLGGLVWPTTSASTACDPAAFARFREDVPAGTSCVTEVADICADCAASSLDWTRIVADKLYATPDEKSSVTVTIKSVAVRSTADGSSTPLAPSALGATASVPVGSDCECQNALLSAALTVTYDGAGAVTGAEAVLEVANLTAAAATAVGIPQQFSLTFKDADGPATEPANNLFARAKSGNPGYLDGLPVVAGSVVTQGSGSDEKRAVQPLSGGLEVFAPTGGGTCPSAGSAEGQGTPVLFGYDAVVECGEELTAALLKARCESGAAPPALEVNATRVGLFGNADPLRANQWLELAVAAAGPAGTYTAATGTCSELVDGVHYEFVVARVGQATSPQRKIVAARARYSTTEWALPRGAASAVLPLRATASFHLLGDSQLEGFVPPAPPLLPELPQDLFFPFTTSAAPPRVAGPHAAVGLAVAVAGVAVVLRRAIE